MSKWAIVVPSHRPERLNAWTQVWGPALEKHDPLLILVHDAESPFPGLGTNLETLCLSWRDLPDWMPRKTDMVRSWGIYQAWRIGCDYTLTLDDDVLPTADLLAEYEAVFDTGAPCSDYLDVGALTSSGLHMRGFPYADRKHATVGLQYGGWSGCLDYDAATQLAVPRPDETFHPVAVPVPRGAAVTGCIMNAAWRTEYAPLMWQLMMFEGRYNRFGDIWSGLYAKRVLDSLGVAVVVNGRAQVRHERASDPFVSLEREAPGNGPNEGLWRALGRPRGCGIVEAYRHVTDSAATFFAATDPEYARAFKAARDKWLALFEPRAAATRDDRGVLVFDHTKGRAA